MHQQANTLMVKTAQTAPVIVLHALNLAVIAGPATKLLRFWIVVFADVDLVPITVKTIRNVIRK